MKRPPRRRWLRALKITTALLALPAIVVSIFLIRYYYIFDGLIQQKLGKKNSVSETEIYSSPMVLFPGKRISRLELVAHMRRAGYLEQGKGSSGRVSTYSPAKRNHLVVHNEPSLPFDGGRTVEVVCDENSIRSLRESGTGKPAESLALKPEMLSNFITKSREKRRYVPYRDLPKPLVNAILAAEDRRFFVHSGIDPFRIISALIVDIREGDTVQGASTLTQQFVKNYFLTPERTWRRKMADAYMSILLEQRLSKEEIFELYCNEVYLGQRGSFGIVGVGEAAETYFDKNVRDLALDEAATIAGIITAPNRFTPARYPDRAKARRNLVLDLMTEYAFITPADRDAARAKPMHVKPSSVLNYSGAPYFVDYLQDVLVDNVREAVEPHAKYKVYTSLNTELQQAAFEAVRAGVLGMDAHFAKGKRAIPPGTVQAALIAVDPKTGRILAMVGGRSYGQSQFNRITEARRQPGSIFKPFVYAAALETAYSSSTPLTAVSTVLDEPSQFDFEDLVYEPRNYKEEYLGQVTMRQAVTKSLNVATIKFAEKVGYDKITELAHRLGLNEEIKPFPAMAIGAFEVTPIEMVKAYTAFANGGLLSELTPILEVRDSAGKLVPQKPAKPEQVLSPEIAFMTTSLLQSVIDHGTGASVRSRGFALPAAGKTGTSRDGWFAGYTPDLLCIVWVGFDDNRELNLSGSQSALPIWAEFMKRISARLPLTGGTFEVPENVVQVEIDPTTGLLATDRCLEKEMEYFISGSQPAVHCYGNTYEQNFSGTPANIYATPAKEPHPGADNKSVPAEKGPTL